MHNSKSINRNLQTGTQKKNITQPNAYILSECAFSEFESLCALSIMILDVKCILSRIQALQSNVVL